MEKLKAIDLFAGIGGIRTGFQLVFKNDIEFVFSSEMNPYSVKTYELNFNEIPTGDITKVEEKNIPNHDIILAGFPCQAFSVAGKRRGFEDTRGTLFFDVARIAKYHKPKVLFLENVKGLVGHDNGKTIEVIRNTLEELGYKVYMKVLNTKNFKIAQNRERIYIVAFLDHSVDFEYPEEFPNQYDIKNHLIEEVDEKYYINKLPLYEKVKDEIVKEDTLYQWRYNYVRENKSQVCPTLTTQTIPLLKDKKGIRYLTPRECANFQSFPKDFKFPDIKDRYLYQQFGNSVTVKVIEEIAKKIKEVI